MGSEKKKRWYKPIGKEWGDLADDFDKIRSGVEVMGAYTRSAQAALARARDRIILAGFYDVNYVGEDGTETVAFKTTNVVPASSSGLTVGKILDVRSALVDSGFLPGEDVPL